MHQDEQDRQLEELCAQLHALELLYTELCIDLNHRHAPCPDSNLGHDATPLAQLATKETNDYTLAGLHLLSWPENPASITQTEFR